MRKRIRPHGTSGKLGRGFGPVDIGLSDGEAVGEKDHQPGRYRRGDGIRLMRCEIEIVNRHGEIDSRQIGRNDFLHRYSLNAPPAQAGTRPCPECGKGLKTPAVIRPPPPLSFL
ncbi:hypothetical protein RHECNPAF_430032 [Rhizobium etli CNPAF512]|nr:hypothetical protein RHECNPAF_430032 [Rhizobium etli CNPAF512]